MSSYFWLFKYVVFLILLYFYLSKNLNAWLLLVRQYFYIVVFLLNTSSTVFKLWSYFLYVNLNLQYVFLKYGVVVIKENTQV